MYEYQNNILSIPAKLLYKDWGLMKYSYYLKLCSRGKLVRTSEGRGLGNQAWVSFNDLPVVKGIDTKAFCVRMLGNPKDMLFVNQLEQYIVPDPKAIEYFALHRKPNGKPLKLEEQRIRATSCMILNAIETVIKDPLKIRKFSKKKLKIWENMSFAVNNLNTQKWHFKLPANQRSLQRKYNAYINIRYDEFIHKGEGAKNRLKVTKGIERLIIALYCLPNKPYANATYDKYLQFMGGALTVYDYQTGEVFNREHFFDENGQIVELAESTIWNYINKPENKIIIAKIRNGDYDFSHKIRPHVNRHAPMYSMSKISLDDRDIMHTQYYDGKKKKRVLTYYAFDDLSGAMIGITHSKKKDHALFLNCIRNMFQFTSSYNLGVPMQIEVERHLTTEFEEGLLKAGVLFPFVRFCNPTNSQEKYSERQIRTKKYGVEKDRHQNVGRHYARLDSNRTTLQKIFDEHNDNYREATATYEEIVAWDLEEQQLYNNELHHNQVKFKGKTRLEVFLENVNPNLPKLNKALLSQYIGEHTKTTILRNQYVTVQYGKYQLPNPQTIMMLQPNNYNVDAYYIPVNNEVKEVFLYQKGEFICKCKPVPIFNRANAEWTDEDALKYQEAMKYIQQFDAMTKGLIDEKVSKVGIMSATAPIEVSVEVVEEKEEKQKVEIISAKNIEDKALNDL